MRDRLIIFESLCILFFLLFFVLCTLIHPANTDTLPLLLFSVFCFLFLFLFSSWFTGPSFRATSQPQGQRAWRRRAPAGRCGGRLLLRSLLHPLSACPAVRANPFAHCLVCFLRHLLLSFNLAACEQAPPRWPCAPCPRACASCALSSARRAFQARASGSVSS